MRSFHVRGKSATTYEVGTYDIGYFVELKINKKVQIKQIKNPKKEGIFSSDL